MSLPYSSSNPAGEEKKQECLDAGKAIRILLEKDIKPRDIMTREPLKTQLLWCLF
jgi:dihydroxy-acid dehydratase